MSVEGILSRLRESKDSEYYRLKSLYKNLETFNDIDRESGNIKDLTDELDNKGISYELYYHKRDNGVTIFYESTKVYEGNAVSNDLPPKIGEFLQDFAQEYKGLGYNDIIELGKRWKTVLPKELSSAVSRIISKIRLAIEEDSSGDIYNLCRRDPRFNDLCGELVDTIKNINSTVSIGESVATDTDNFFLTVLDPKLSDAVIEITGSGLDDSSYDYYEGGMKGQGIIYLENDTKKVWKDVLSAIEQCLSGFSYYDAEIYSIEEEETHSPDIKAYRIKFRASKDEISESIDEESDEYLSSFVKDVMKEVNAKAPDALRWRRGDLIHNSTTKQDGEFQGYKRDALGRLYAFILSNDGEEVKYSLEDLQQDIENNVLLRGNVRVVREDADEEEDNRAYQEFVNKCQSNSTWKKVNAICTKYGYKLSNIACVDVKPSGSKSISLHIVSDRTKNYNPEIYFSNGKFGSSDPSFEIQTTAHGALNMTEYEEFLKSVTGAYNMIKEISNIDLYTLYNYTEESSY